MRGRAIARGAVVSACALVLSACGAGSPTPHREADAVGTASTVVADAGNVRVEFAPDPGYEYYESTVFVLDDDVSVTGTVSATSEIRQDDRLRVWTGVCAESFPVQCTVDAVEVLD